MRLFIGVPLPEEICEYLSTIKGDFKDVDASWVPKQNFHVTLKFLGDVSENKVGVIVEKLKSIKVHSFHLTIDEFGFFPNNRHPKVFWASVKPHDQIFELHKFVDMGLSKYFPMESDYVPHITLARIRNPKTINCGTIRQIGFEVNSFKLYESTLTALGPIYEVKETFHLND